MRGKFMKLGSAARNLYVSSGVQGYGIKGGRGQLKCDGTRAETRFRLLTKRTSPFKSAGGVSSVDY
jgi:hypothetical protein